MIADTTFGTLAVRRARRRSDRDGGGRINVSAVAGLALSAGLWGALVITARMFLGA